jgi:hypothetical protein
MFLVFQGYFNRGGGVLSFIILSSLEVADTGTDVP